MINSRVLFTEEIDDPEIASEELFSQAEGFEFQDSTVAILFMDVETVYAELYEQLRTKWDFPIVAATAIGMLTDHLGYSRTGISVMLLTSSDCKFAAGMTEGVTCDNYIEPIKKTYEDLEKQLGGEEVKIALLFSGRPDGMCGDDIVNALDKVGKKVKVFGALASDMFSFADFRVALNDRIVMNEQVFILVSGNVDPKILRVMSISGKANFSYEVTKSSANLVYRLGNGTFLEALKNSGLGSDNELVAGEYIQTPFITKLKMPDGSEVEALRNLARLDQKDGSGMFLGAIAEGTSLEIGLLNRDDVKSSVKQAFDEILAWLDKEGKDCKTILCCSCSARFLALGNNGIVEGESYKDRLPEGISLMGLYSYGEFSPVGDEEWCNVFHNSTFTILCI